MLGLVTGFQVWDLSQIGRLDNSVTEIVSVHDCAVRDVCVFGHLKTPLDEFAPEPFLLPETRPCIGLVSGEDGSHPRYQVFFSG